MNTLVVYGTKTGCTAGIAAQIGNALSEKGATFVERTILKMMKAPEGDHRDMKAVAEWATSIASQLGA